MSGRLKFQGTKIISESGDGPIKAVWTAHGDALAVFSVKERNDLMRAACMIGGQYWITAFLAKRFESAYAKRLGYRVSSGYASAKKKLAERGVIEDGDTPLVYTGVLRQKALSSANVQVTATSKKQQIRIKIPTAHATKPIVSVVLKSLPGYEIERIAENINEALVAGIQGRLEERETQRQNAPPARPGEQRRDPFTGKFRTRGT